MPLSLFARTKTSHHSTIHLLRYYFLFSTHLIPSTWRYQFFEYTCRGLTIYFSLHLRPPINQPAVDAGLLFMSAVATMLNYLTVYSFQLIMTPLFVQFWCIPVEGLASISIFTCAPINQPALDADLLFMTAVAAMPNYLTVYSFQLFMTPLFVQFLVYTCRRLTFYFSLHLRPP